jgi:hypothetical protein
MLTAALVSAGRELASDSAAVHVPDFEPGTFFYVLTEDCETFDGGEKTGDYPSLKSFGNRNNFMDPEEYRIQMIEKPDALNAIADRHGAKWTHFWTVPQRFAAQWAAGRSGTGAWADLVRKLDGSIRRGSRRHEYAPHIHFDFEPDSKLPPQPRLLYDAATDGILPNEYYDAATNPDHKYHGWDGARKGIAYVRREGDLADPDSKIGSLRKAMRYLSGLSFTGRLALTVRTGAADFGVAPDDLAASRKAAFANGLLGNSDSGIYERTPLPRGRQIYFCRAEDLGAEITDLADASLVQLRAPDVSIEQGMEAMNGWFGRRYWESRGPGVRAAVAMTHAMFLKGSPDPFRDSKGGDFETLDHHLDHVRRHYPDVRFATASEATLEFLDYYTPTPRAVATRLKARSRDGGILIYEVRVLGKGIPISEEKPANLAVQAPPLFDPGDIRAMTVLHNGTPVPGCAWTAGGGELPAASFRATRRDGYDLKIETARPMGEMLDPLPASPSASAEAVFEEPAEEVRPDLLKLDGPVRTRGEVTDIARVREGDEWEWAYPGDLFDLLVHPIAGGEHPLGRRLHPYGRISEGIPIDAARRQFGDAVRPVRFEVKWTRPVYARADFRLVSRADSVTPEGIVMASSVYQSGIEVARVRLFLARKR